MSELVQKKIDMDSTELVERLCPRCDSPLFVRIHEYSKDEWRIGECGNCKFVYLQNAPIYDRLVEEFAWEKTRPQEMKRRYKDRPITARLSMAFRRIRKPFRASEQALFAQLFKPGPVLDVGCGHGGRVLEPFTPYGIELSKQLFEDANARMTKRGGHCVHAPAVEGISEFEPNFFSGIVLRSFLEHEWQPKTLLNGCQKVLKDGGVVFVRVPNFASINRRVRGGKWCGFRYPDHVNYFTPDSLSSMAGDCGFDMKLLNPIKISIDDNIKAVLTKRPASGAEN